MRCGPALATLAALLLAACGGEQLQFVSEKERQCYFEAEAALTDPNTTLQRGRSGVFVEVTRINGFIRDTDSSEVFRTCMASSDTARGPVVVEAAPISFTPQEQTIWNGLSDAQKREALVFIQQGGTLRQFIAS